MVTKLDDLLELVKAKGKKKLVVAYANDSHTIGAVSAAIDRGIVDATLVGDIETIKKVCAEEGINPDKFELVQEANDVKAGAKAVIDDTYRRKSAGLDDGNGMQQLPMANPTDGYFDMMMLKDISPFKILKNIKNLYKGNLEQIPEIRFTKATDIHIGTDPYILGEIEGDVLPTADYHISMIPGALRILTAL